MSNIAIASQDGGGFVDQPELSPQEVADDKAPDEAEALYFDWNTWALDKQRPPEGDWTTWLLLGGRGSGKTRAGAEWVRSLAAQKIGPIALVGETMTEAVSIMVRGESGILNVTPELERPTLRGNQLVWPNGVEASVMSASDPDRFRGPQFAAAWCDEVAKWPHGEDAWDQLQFGLRLGDRPRQLATTTPRPTRLLKRLLADRHTIVTHMATVENKAQLAPQFLEAVVARYQGTVLGRQELDGELIEDLPGALWQRGMFRPFGGEDVGRIVVAVDPPVTGHAGSDACGIVVAGRMGEGAVVLEDCTLKQVQPLEWARRAVAAYEAGCRWFDTSFGGVGGHPVTIAYGGGRTGNIATEDLVNMFESEGVSTGLDLDRMMAASKLCEDILGRPLDSMVARAGLGPVRHKGKVDA